jgi:uncharacterized protein (TIGR00369 family)
VTDRNAAPPPPDGFVILPRGPFMTLNGPVYYRPDAAPEGAEQAIFVRESHTNNGGILHGGMMASFLDVLLGAAARDGAGRQVVTVQMSIEYHRMVRPGEWLMGKARMTHSTRDLVFAEGHAFVGSRAVARASGVFKMMGQIRPQS